MNFGRHIDVRSSSPINHWCVLEVIDCASRLGLV